MQRNHRSNVSQTNLAHFMCFEQIADPFHGALRKSLKRNKFQEDIAFIFHRINRVRPNLCFLFLVLNLLGCCKFLVEFT